MTARTHTLETRKAALSDALALCRLTLLLGYDCTEVAMRQRLVRLRDDAAQALFVAALDGNEVVGWVHVELRRPVFCEPFAEITALVVSDHHRRMGVGRALAERAGTWAEAQHTHDLRAVAQLHREDALEFYEGLGFELHAETQVYRRTADDDLDVTGSPTLVE